MQKAPGKCWRRLGRISLHVFSFFSCFSLLQLFFKYFHITSAKSFFSFIFLVFMISCQALTNLVWMLNSGENILEYSWLPRALITSTSFTISLFQYIQPNETEIPQEKNKDNILSCCCTSF